MWPDSYALRCLLQPNFSSNFEVRSCFDSNKKKPGAVAGLFNRIKALCSNQIPGPYTCTAWHQTSSHPNSRYPNPLRDLDSD